MCGLAGTPVGVPFAVVRNSYKTTTGFLLKVRRTIAPGAFE
jgi:hypothetical protein